MKGGKSDAGDQCGGSSFVRSSGCGDVQLISGLPLGGGLFQIIEKNEGMAAVPSLLVPYFREGPVTNNK